MTEMPLGSRLIVAVDYDPKKSGGIKGVKEKIFGLAYELEGTGVIFKVNSSLRALGYELIEDLHNLGIEVFADLKLIDIPNTMAIDGRMLREVKPEIVTVMGCAGAEGIIACREALGPDIEILVVTVLTTTNTIDSELLFGCSSKAGVVKFAQIAQLAGATGLILSSKEIELFSGRSEITLDMNAPNFRPEWTFVKDDDQISERAITLFEAFKGGAKRAVMGRPILNAGPNDKGLPQSPREAVERSLEEIQTGLDARAELND